MDYRYHILDMRNIDCETLIGQDTPEALILAVLCDFKRKPAQDAVNYIVTRLKTLTGEDEKGFRKLPFFELNLEQGREEGLKQAIVHYPKIRLNIYKYIWYNNASIPRQNSFSTRFNHQPHTWFSPFFARAPCLGKAQNAG
jgi:hypothetical protein